MQQPTSNTHKQNPHARRRRACFTTDQAMRHAQRRERQGLLTHDVVSRRVVEVTERGSLHAAKGH